MARQSHSQKQADRTLIGAFAFIVFMGGFGMLVAPRPAAVSSGTTTFYGSETKPVASVVYAALPANPETGTAPSLFGQDPGKPTERLSPTEKRSAPIETRTIRGKRVPLRSEARVGSSLVDRLNTGQAVEILEERGDWIRVRVELTRREGWVPAKRVSNEAADDEPEKATPKISPALSAAAIAKLLIAESIASYSGPCACPYQADRRGHSCGRRSAYTRPGGAAPLCFAGDVTPAMIASYRANH